ncbi:lipopolysaccharide heptosyltransferase I [Arcobacter nitrofigilis DSM 7299]|uniref:Lipopolysaccharide heptosyltransferase 1 n=1 Tax=Arcobacter nitrofigilis (strain ATCC 33309 / DSM 7299 / CCUG 15893 / LMG 7604 / NCTC 12251 / CI) TaxID=572480 RepID=D5V0U1_ARCNC|nr:lipopolysaccharide heptosyltransferase I [Arcobacter nitrofigilis]ADG93903.1 lipopolysaccharide heptosyltransferase I [Arcobacter nitrofigilis DSM 7299]
MNQIKKLAIVKLSAMGDIIHAMVALQYIKKNYPNISIDWFVEESFSQVLQNNPHINNIYSINLKSIKKNKLEIFNQIKLIKNYSKNNYDLVIDAQGLIKSAIVSRLLGNSVAGFDKNSIREKSASLFYNKKVSIPYDENTIDRNVKVLSSPLDFEITSKMILEKEPFLFYKDENSIIYDYLDKDKKNIVFVIGSTWESRNYPKEKFLKIANELKENCVVVWGSENEKEKAFWLESNSEFIKALPKIDLNSLKAFISKSDLLIGNDTGPTHMAWALNIPSITIFGPTPINRIYQTSINKIVKSNSKVNHYKLDKNDFSITKIDEKIIIKEAKSLLYG